MVDGSETVPTGALDDVAFLSRSANRVEILQAIASGPAPRRELASLTDTSRTTLDRIVNELEDRGWVERTTAGEYAATPAGRHLLGQFLSVVRSAEAIRQLGDAVAWLPTDELSIGLYHFADATVVRPDGDDPIDTVDYMTELIRPASTFRALTHLTPPGPFSRAMCEGVVSDRLTVEGVVTAGNLQRLRGQPDRRERWRDLLEAGAGLYRWDGPVPCNLWIADETVLIKGSDPEVVDEAYGVPIVTEDETVRSWAHDLIDEYRDGATRVDVDDFTESASTADDP